MEAERTTLGEIVEQLVGNYGTEMELNGALVVFWNEDNSVGAAYAGTPIEPPQAVDLALSGARAMLQQIHPAAPAGDDSPASVRLVESEE